MRAIHCGRPAAVPARRPGVKLLLTAVLALLLAMALAGAAPAGAAQPQGSAPEFLALLALQQAQLTAADGAVHDFFGSSVAVSGDMALVGAPGDDVDVNGDRGSAYVFTRSGTTWTFQQRLTAPDGADSDEFGCSVAVSGDTALVGAQNHHVGVNDYQGSAYVFTRSGSSWTFQQQLTAPDGIAADYFGVSVALSGETALVGAPYDDVGATSWQGSAYVFTRSGSTWTFQQQLTVADGVANDVFGYAVALSGDTALVGAPYDDVDAKSNQGSAYVFTRSGTTWTFQQKLVAGDGADDDFFGFSVALSGETALVGVQGDDVGASDQGSACVFTRSGTTWTFQQQLTVASAYDYFGAAVALSGDTALIAAPSDDITTNTNAGSAYVFTRSGSTWTFQQQLTAADGGAKDDEFGCAVALSGGTALVGAHWDDVGAIVNQGSAWAYLLDSTAPTTAATLAPTANAAGWCKKPVSVTLTATDDLTGVVGTEYRLAGATAWTPYAAPFVVSTQGVTNWECRSSDVAGNAETAQTVTVNLDSRKPTTRAYAATVKKGKKVKLAYKVSDAKPGCGRAKVTLKLYKGKKLKKTIRVPGTCACNAKKTYSWRCKLAAGSYTIKVYATDIAGNAQRKVGSARLTVR